MKKINRLLAFLLAFTVVITTFSSDLTTAHVYATEAETVIDSEDEIKTVEKEEIPVVSEASTEESTEASTEGSTEEAATAADTEENAGEGDENDDAATTGIDGEVVNPEAVGEETAEEEEEEEESEAKTLSAEVNGIKITLEADAGVLPSDAELRVAAIEETDEVEVTEDAVKEAIESEVEEEVSATYSFDINIYSESKGDPDNNGYVQPDTDRGDVTVTFDSIEEAKDEAVSLEVFHVEEKDGEITNVEPVKSDYASDTADEVTITAEHFSIYTVTVKKKNPGNFDNSYELNIYAVQKDTNISLGVNNAYVSKDQFANFDNITPASVAPSLEGYKFYKAYLKGSQKKYEIKSFSEKWGYFIVPYRYLAANYGNGESVDASDYTLYFEYELEKPRQYVTWSHLDLGFTDEEFEEYKNAEAEIFASINGSDYIRMGITGPDNGYDKELKSWEYRLDLGENGAPSSVKVTDTIKFMVRYDGQEVFYEPKTADNQKAYENCFDAHKSIQNTFGFDYKVNLKDKFKVEGNLIYDLNVIPVRQFGEKQDGKGKTQYVFTAKDITALETLTDNADNKQYLANYIKKQTDDGFEFLGWADTRNATSATYEIGSEIKFNVSDKQKVVYPVWKQLPVYTVTYNDGVTDTQIFADDVHDNVRKGTKTPAFTKGNKDGIPVRDNYSFDGWKKVGEQGNKLYSNSDLSKIDVDGSVTYQAVWSAKNVKVAVYASDGTSSTTANKQLERLLGLKYVQDDGYYPVGVVELPASLFTGKTSPYIKTEDDWTPVYNSLGNIDKSYLQNRGSENNNNSVQSNLGFVQMNYNCGAGNHETALFDWKKAEHTDARYNTTSIKQPATGVNYEYHLDLRFTTNTVKYDGVYFVNGVNPSKVQSIETVDFLTGQSVTSDDHPSMDSHKTKDGNEYTFDGFYQNEECTVKFDSKVVSDDNTVIYAKFNRVENYSVEYRLTSAPEGVNAPNKDQNITYNTLYTVKTATDVEGYDFDGWYYNAVEGQTAEKKMSFNVTENVVLTGSYTKQTGISYKVQYWLQNAEDNDYKPFGDPVSKSGAFGDQAVYDKNDGMFGDGFHYAETKVNNVKITDDTTIKVPAKDKAELVINVYYDRNEFEVTYAYVGSDIPEIVDPTVSELVGYKKTYRFGQEVKLRADAVAPGYTFNGWKAYPNKEKSSDEIEQKTVEVAPESEGVVAAVKLFFATITRKITGEDGKETTTTSFKMPASNVCVEGSFTKTPYQIVLKLKGNAKDEGFDYEKVYNATEQSAEIDFVLEVCMEGSEEPLTALNVSGDSYETLMASIDNVMSLGTLTVYAAEEDMIGDQSTTATYTGEDQEVAKSVTKTVTIEGREYSVTVELAGGKGKTVKEYPIYVKNISFKLGEKDVSDLFETDIKVNDIVGKLKITPATLTIKADDKYKAYGASDPEWTASISGLLGEDVSAAKMISDYLKDGYIFSREPGNEAGGKYPIHVTFEGMERPTEQQLRDIPVELVEIAERVDTITVIEDDDNLPPVIKVLRNYWPAFEDGTLTIGPAGGGDDEEYVPRDPDADSPVAAAPAPAVLGAQRELPGEAPAVLGARRAGTSDTNILGSIITIIVAAAIAFSMVFIKRKKKEEN